MWGQPLGRWLLQTSGPLVSGETLGIPVMNSSKCPVHKTCVLIASTSCLGFLVSYLTLANRRSNGKRPPSTSAVQMGDI